ncbi:hypothetical protein GCM10009775_34220 [Microbacterium aoyamense]|uniref:DUF2332 domain-containing protein n=1 Tax=Microbacterium aoyamense TaxID=344166 RepID=A0ABN2PZI2_9MICO|nr:DUF2332 domain-containing protein [Microbacterium aoyamense]
MSSDIDSARERYARFAADEAPGRSALYEEWAAGAASDDDLLALLARIPATHRQPPLVFAVARLLGSPESGFASWREWMLRHADSVVAEASRRTLQTNEPMRCAVLLPALAAVDGSIALLEIGASAGLCLYPDRYAYRYRGDVAVDLDPPSSSTVVLECAVTGAPPLRLPDVVWRGGIDLAPLDPASADDRRFLTTLVWPGETGRRDRIEGALDIAAADPPVMWRGDASEAAVLDTALAAAPDGATLVVTTPGVLPHIPRVARERLIGMLRARDLVWISIDPPGVHGDGFALSRDGRPLADVDPLGASLEWRAGAEDSGR